MADEQIVTNIVANADFSNLIADVHKVTASLSQLQEKIGSTNKTLANQIAVMNRTFSDTMRSTGQFSTHFVSLTSDVDKFGRNLDTGKLKLKDYFRTWQEHTKTSGGLIRQLAQQQVQLQNAVLQPLGRNAQGLMQFNVHVPRGLDTIRNKTALAKQELQIMNKVIQDGGVQLINWGKNTQWAGRQLTVGLTVPMAAFGKAAADAFKVADQELTRLTKVYGDIAGTSAQELSRVRSEVAKTSKELSAAYGVNFQETIGLAADIAATGKTGNELLASVKETTRLAVLGEVDRQDAMKATLAIQSAFKANTEELSQSINFLNAVENQTSTTLNDLVEAIPKAGPVIKGLGGDVKDLALYLTAMREGGVSASEGANALKSALASLINPTDKAVEKFQGFGIDLLGIVNNNAGNVTGTLMSLQAALDKLDPLQKQQAIEQLFGKFQFSRLNALFENLGRQGSQTLQVLDLMKASAGDLEAVAGRELAQVTESASGRYRRAIEALRADLATIGENFLNISTAVINFVDKIINAVDKLPKPIKQALTLVGGITAIAGPIIMLTGVLANFFGYIIKGLGHFKALFKGGEGFKLLTPEILAAQQAGTLMEDTFYSDAKAATILSTAVRNLNDELGLLQQKVTSGQISAQPVFSRVSEGVAVVGGPRVVDPSHPLAGDISRAPRASAHMNPRNPGDPATIFGLVPSAEPVNRRIGRTPMMYMQERLPNVEGLTSVGGISTGIVAGEAARYHALMATIGMQSRQEIENLKKTIAVGGAVSSEFIQTFDDILPLTTALTQKAAQESAMIVAELRQGKLTVENARAQIIALNADIERQMGLQVTEFAAQRGRTIDLTKAPLIDQPVVNTQGKSNLRGMFRKGIFGKVMSAVGRATRTRTFGAPYNIEVTKPSGFRNGGVEIQRFAGGFTPGNAIKAAALLRAFAGRSKMIGGLRTPRRSTIGAGEKGVGVTFGQLYKRNSPIYSDPDIQAYGITPTSGDDFLVHAMVPGFRKRTSGLQIQGRQSVPSIPRDRWEEFGISTTSGAESLQALPSQFIKNTHAFNDALKRGATGADFRPVSGDDMVSLLLFLKDQGVAPHKAKIIANRAAEILNTKVMSSRVPITEAKFGDMLNNASVRALASGFKPKMVPATPKGTGSFWGNPGLVANKYKKGITQVPGYGGGDIIPALIEPGESVVTKEATSGNQGALTLMNAGFRLDDIMGAEEGVVSAGQAYKAGLKNPIGGGLVRGGMRPMGFGAQMGLGLAGGIAGQMIGGPAGMAVSLASNFLPMLGMLKGIGGMIPSITKIATLLGRLTIPGAVIGTLALGTKLLLDWKKRAEEAGKANRLVFGGTENTLAEVGLKYTTINSKLKSINEQLELQKAKGLESYAALTQSGVPGLTLTIKELADKIEEAKTKAKETVGAFNAIDSSKVTDLASSLKQQYISAGMSVQEATNQIYAIIKASDKANMALTAITSKSFVGIKDQASAAKYSVESLAKVLGDRNLFNAEEFGRGIDNMLNSIETYRQSLVGTKEGDKTLTQTDALKITLDKIKAIKGANNKLDQDAIKAIQQQNLILGAVLGKAETLASVYAKMALLQAGFGGDIAGLNADDAVLVAQGMQAYSDAVATAVADTKGPLGGLATLYNKAKKAAESSATAAKNAAKLTSDAIDAEIKKRQKLIDDLKKEEAARLALLDAQEKQADFNTSIKQAQIAYQEALATGDMAQAAQEQLNIQKLTADRQRELARTAIQDKYAKEIEKLQAEIDKLQEQKNKQQNAATASQTNATNKLADQMKIQGYMDRFAAAAKLYPNADKLTGKDKEAAMGTVAQIFADMMKEGGEIAKEAEKLKAQYGTGGKYEGSTFIPKVSPEIGILKSLSTKGFELAGAGEFAAAVDKFAKYIDTLVTKNPMAPTGPGPVAVNPKTPVKDTSDSKNLSDAQKAAESGAKQSRMVVMPNGVTYTVFTYKGKTYASPVGSSGEIYPYENNALGKRIKDPTKMQTGGYISGPGTGTSDSIPAMLSNGEYVINAKSVASVGIPTLDNINRMAKGGPVFARGMGAYSTGGRYKFDTGGPVMGNNALYNINVTLNGTDLSPEDVAKAIDQQMRMREAMNGRSRNF